MAKLEQFFTARQWAEIQRKSAIIPMGVTLPERQLPDGIASSDPMIILFLGRLVEKKGVQFLLPAFAAVRAAIGHCQLIIAGDGPMHALLRRRATDLGLSESVHFAGFVTGREKSALLQRAAIVVLPSIITRGGDSEGLPVALMEALAYGKICIATAESGADEVLDSGLDGFVVPQKDIASLSGAILAAAGLGPTPRATMQAAARLAATRFDWATVARRYHDVLLAPRDHGKHGAAPDCAASPDGAAAAETRARESAR